MITIKSAKERTSSSQKKIRKSVGTIIDEVIKNGDAAVKQYAALFDNTKRKSWRVEKSEIESAYSALTKTEIRHIKLALKNIRTFAIAQRKTIGDLKSFFVQPGLELGHNIVPVDSTLCYVPGGSYPLYSTALMLITPAKIAGVNRIAACSPPVKNTESINAKTLVAMDTAGADEIYCVGGVQAIAAFAYGTKQILPVDMIVGPGNAYVAEAKRQCYGQVGIDFPAGPSEVLIIADTAANPNFVAADILAQCEHDKNAQAILLCDCKDFAKKIIDCVEVQLKSLSTACIAGSSWRDYGAVYVYSNIDEACDFANKRASEHVELQCKNNNAIEKKLKNYGSLFIGSYSAEVFGDYASGPNHTLPTMGASRYSGGLWVGSFLKTLCRQCASKEAAADIAPLAEALALGEGLAGHANAAALRKNNTGHVLHDYTYQINYAI
ncbi:MAG: histidinol dehydrogenase [Termitinemataceae bacterium]|nr:MAG: histidinol dehydrogenase [Termitinemataceae bacterium]